MAGQEQRIERGKSKKLNRHGDHVASCLCCEHFEFEAETGPYSDLTPGDSSSMRCLVGVFNTVYRPDADDMHVLQVTGQACSMFRGRR